MDLLCYTTFIAIDVKEVSLNETTQTYCRNGIDIDAMLRIQLSSELSDNSL